MVRWSHLFIFNIAVLWHCLALATPSSFTYQGQIIKPNGQALEASNVNFIIEVVSPGAEECVLYRENHTLNMNSSNGIFAIEVGTGTQSGSQYQDTTDLQTALNNSTGTVNPDLCVMGGSYTPSLTDGRRLRISFDDGSGLVTLSEDHNVVSVPYANSASSLDGLGSTDFIQVNSGPGFNLNQTNANFVFNDANWTELQALLDGSSSSFSAPPPSTDVDNNNQKIINLADPSPSTDSDAVNVGYARSYIGGQQVDTTDIAALGAGQDGEVLTWDGSQWNSELINDTSKLPIAGGTMTGAINMGNQNISNANDITANNDINVGNNLSVTGGIGVTTGINSAGDINLANESELQLAEATGNGTDYVSLKAPANLAGPVNLTLPVNDGDPGQFLQTDGSGLLSWQSVTAGVSSFNTRTGAVTAQASDYDAVQVDFDNTYGGDVDSATEVQGAIEELSSEKLAKSGDSMTGNLVMDLNTGVTTELRFQDTGTKYVGFQAPNNINAVSSFVWTLPDDDGGAGQVLQTSGAGILSWTSVASESRTVTAGQGLTGGGDLSANRTFDIGAGNGITVNANDIAVTPYNGISVDSNGVSVTGGNGINVDGTGVNVDIAGTADETTVEATDSLLIRDNSDAGNLKEMTRANFVLSESEVDSFVSNNGFFQDGGNNATGDLTLGNNDNFGLNFETNDATAMTITNGGSVGIGTTIPMEKFHLYGNTDSIHRLRVENTSSGTSARSSITSSSDVASAVLVTYSSLNNQGLGYGTLTADNLARLRANNSSTFLIDTIDTSPIVFGTDNTERLRISASGSIGIGTTNPNTILEVIDDSHPRFNRARTNNGTSSGAGLRLTRSFDGGVGGAGIGVHQDFYVETTTEGVEEPVAQIGAIATDATTGAVDSYFYIQTHNNGTSNEAIRILNTGNVGVGTSTPTSLLQVAGGVQIGDDAAPCDGTKAGTLKYNGGTVSYCDGTSWEAFGTAAGGEVNTASNVGLGVGVFSAKNGTDLEFKAFNAGSTKISVSGSATAVTLDIAEANFDAGVIPVGTTTLTAANLEAALNELDSDKAESARIIASGAGLTGGGDLSTDRTLAVGAGNGITVNADDIAVTPYNGITVDTNGVSVNSGNGILVDGSGVHVDVNGTTAETTVNDADELLIYDTSATALRKMTRDNFVLSDAEVQTIVNAMGVGDILNGGNSEGSAVTVGTNDLQSFNLETNNTTAINIDSSQNINLEGNAYLYDFLYGSNSGNYLRMGNTAGVGGVTLFSANDYVELRGNNTADIRFTTNNTERMRVTSNGNVGIGTTSPTDLLDVDGVANIDYVSIGGGNATGNTVLGSFGRVAHSWSGASSTQRVTNDNSSNNTSISIVEYERSRFGVTSDIQPNFGGNISLKLEGATNATSPESAQINWAWENAQTNDTTDRDAYLSFSTMLDNTLNEAFRINSQGWMGIGTTAPREALDVHGKLTLGNSAGGDAGIAYFSRGSDGNETVKLGYTNASEDNEFQFYHSGGDGFFTWSTNDTIVEEQMRLDNQGRLGIGTSSPTAELDVNGTVVATAFQGDGSALTGITASSSSSGESASNYVINTDSDGSTGDGGVLFQSNGSTVASVSEAGSINANSGSAGSAGFGFQGDPNTGLFSPAADTVSLTAGGVEALRANSVASAVNYVEINPAITGEGPTIASAGADANIDLNFSPKGTGNTIFSNGNVGIGSTSPAYPLDVVGVGRFSNSVKAVHYAAQWGYNAAYASSSASNYSPATSGSIPKITLHNTSSAVDGTASYTRFLLNNSSGNIQDAYIGGVSQAGPANFSPDIVFGRSTGASSYSETVRIQGASGNVGIGTTAPSSLLHLYSADARLLIQDDNSLTSFFEIDDNADTQVKINKVTSAGDSLIDVNPKPLDGTGVAKYRLFRDTNTTGVKQLELHKGDGTLDPEVVFGVDGGNSYFNSGGNVGIGTSSPSSPLEVHLNGLNRYADFRDPSQSLATTRGVRIGRDSSDGSHGYVRYYRNSTSAGSRLELGLKDSDAALTVRGDDLVGIGVLNSSAHLEVSAQGTTGGSALMVSSNTGGDGDILIVNEDGTVGVGTTSPRSKLDVDGSISSAPAFAEAAGSIDFANSNFAYSASSCGAFNLHNMKDGATYTLAIQGTAVATCNFSAYATGDTSSPLTVKYPPSHGATTSGAETLYSFVVIGSSVYVAWVPGYTP